MRRGAIGVINMGAAGPKPFPDVPAIVPVEFYGGNSSATEAVIFCERFVDLVADLKRQVGREEAAEILIRSAYALSKEGARAEVERVEVEEADERQRAATLVQQAFNANEAAARDEAERLAAESDAAKPIDEDCPTTTG